MNSFRAKVLFPMGVIILTVIQTTALGVNFDPNQDAIEWTSNTGGNGHWYAYIEGPCSPWSIISEMTSIATGVGAQLVLFNTSDEWEFIKSTFSDIGDASCAVIITSDLFQIPVTPHGGG